jgi:Uma2 family endonuclease
MVTLITDPRLEEELKAQRQAWGGDKFDEVWEGVYVMSPLPNVVHQQIAARLVIALGEVVVLTGRGEVFPGVNLSDRAEDWKYNYRAPDVAVFLTETKAEQYEAHYRGAADFLVEIVSPGDRTREKIPFYSQLGVRELLIVDRQPWSLELYRLSEGQLQLAARSTASDGEVISSNVVPLTFQLLPGEPRPQIQAVHTESGRKWAI